MVASSSSTDPRVVIVGITGNQGGSVANALLASSKPYRLVGITRDPTKPSARAWVDKGVEVVQGNTTVGNMESITEILKGADVFFAVTNLMEHLDFEKAHEVADGKLMVDAAKAAGVKLFIWSGLEALSKVSNNKYPADLDMFKPKDDITTYLKASGLPWCIVPAGAFASNYVGEAPSAPQKQPDGTYVFMIQSPPSTLVPVLDIPKDYGIYVRAAIETPGLGAGFEILTGRLVSFQEIADAVAKVTRKKIAIKQVSYEECKAQGGYPLFAWNMYNCINEFGYYGKKDLEGSQKAAGIVPRTWDQILATWEGPLLKDL